MKAWTEKSTLYDQFCNYLILERGFKDKQEVKEFLDGIIDKAQGKPVTFDELDVIIKNRK